MRYVWICALALVACRPSAPASTAPTLAVPLAAGAIELDGEPEEAAWAQAARSGPFVDARGVQARPFTEARFLRDEHDLYLHLYAADDDLRCPETGADGPAWLCDHFRVTLHAPDGDRVLLVTARGALSDGRVVDHHEDRTWSSHARLGVDRDGTLDDPRDDDEEWAVELAIPLAAVQPVDHRARITIERVDLGGKSGKRSPLRYETTLRFGS